MSRLAAELPANAMGDLLTGGLGGFCWPELYKVRTARGQASCIAATALGNQGDSAARAARDRSGGRAARRSGRDAGAARVPVDSAPGPQDCFPEATHRAARGREYG